MSNREPIDFVVTWVDGADPNWRAEKNRYSAEPICDDQDIRYRDWDLLRYWFRGVEKFAPWVRTIHFVTWGHLPDWLDTNHPKLHIVRHEDYISKEYLPVFNSNVIESFLHQIEHLSEQFVYFNDDTFCIDHVTPDVFFEDGKPCDMLAFQPVIANPENPVMSHIYMNNSLVVARHFDKIKNVKQQPGNYFKIGYPPLYFCYNLLELAFPRYTGFFTSHSACPLCKKTFTELWNLENSVLSETASHRFRSKDDTSIYLFREWQKLTGEFKAKNITRYFSYFNIGIHDKKILRTIIKQKRKFVCINDVDKSIDFDRSKQQLQQAFEKILPEKSSFER